MKTAKKSDLPRELRNIQQTDPGSDKHSHQREKLSSISQQPLGAALLNSSIGVAVTNTHGRFLLVNEVFCRITGYSEEELLSRNWLSLSHPDTHSERNALTWRIEQFKVPGFSVEKKCITKDGREVWLRSSLSSLNDGTKSRLFIALVEDITEQKHAEQALAAKEAELREAQRLGRLGTWQWDPETDVVMWSDELYRTFGLDSQLPPPTFQEHSRLFPAASWDLLRLNVEQTLRTGLPYEIELELIRPDGARSWIVARGEALRDDAGHVYSLRGTAQDITTRKRAELALTKSEEKFVTAFNAVPVAVNLVSASEGRQIEVNDALLQMTGYTREDVIGRTFRELGYWQDPADREKLLQRLLAGERLRNVECRLRRKDGEPYIGLLSVDLIELNGEQCVVSAAMDITELRRAEQEVRSLAGKLALHFQQTMFGVIEFATDFRVNEWNPAAEAIFGYSQQEAIGRDVRELIVPEDLRAEITGLINSGLQEREGRYSTNSNLTKNGREIVCEWFNTPLVQEDRSISGVMALVRDVTAEKRAQSELAASEATLSAIFQSTDDGIWTVDAERFGMMTFNAAASEGFAKRRGGQLRVGMTPDELAPANLAGWWKERYRRALATGAFETDYVANDDVSVYRLSFNPLIRQGKPFGVSVFARNVTTRRQAERELRVSEERYRQLVASSNDWVWEVDANGRYTHAGPQCCEILGYRPEELIGKTPFDLMPQAEAQRVGGLFRAIAAERRPFRALENTNLHKDGHTVVLETNGAPIVDPEGRFHGYRGMDRDITARKQAEEALRESERRLRLALESGRMYAFEWNRKADVMMRSEECSAAVGVPWYPTLEKGSAFLNRLYPEDRERYVDVLSNLTPSENSFHSQYRKTLPDGKLCWIEVRGRGFFDRDGSLVRVVGIAADITERKESEDALRTVSAHLINAQEDERKRLARELHDGVSQSLAVVSIQLSQAANAVSEPELSDRLEKLYEKLQGVLSDIGHLSHELHPSTLKHLGLSSAIRVLCEEVTQAHSIDIEFRDRQAPEPSSKDMALCLYRIAQESLHNVVKHGRCEHAWVELGGDQDEISLSVWDQGVGFETGSIKAGLGLVSMRERLRLVGGRIVISSHPGRGTRVEARVPLHKQQSEAAA